MIFFFNKNTNKMYLLVLFMYYYLFIQFYYFLLFINRFLGVNQIFRWTEVKDRDRSPFKSLNNVLPSLHHGTTIVVFVRNIIYNT